MHLRTLSLIHFKNIGTADLEFSPKLNCFIGDNGSGKTNVLDSIYFLSLCKSAFGLTDGQCVQHGADFFTVQGEYIYENGQIENVFCGFKPGTGKAIKRNGKEYEKFSEHIGLLPIVMVSPSDTSLINESGEDRRRYLNTFISQIDKGYLASLMKYNRLLAERNKLLKQYIDPSAQDLLEVIDMQLAMYGGQIHRRRAAVIEEMLAPLAEYYRALSGGREEIELSYDSELNASPMEELLRANAEKDRMMQHTTVGIHRDDLKMKIGGYPIRKFGSQGQQKSFLIALKLAQYDVLLREGGRKPLMLLDDVFDKLDLYRVEQLIDLVAQERFGQIFITDSDKVRVRGILDKYSESYRLFSIEGGEVTQI